MLAQSLESSLSDAPAARRRSPPIAVHEVPGRSSRIALRRSAASRSPDASPALMKMSDVSGAALVETGLFFHNCRRFATPNGLRREATLRAVLEERDELFAFFGRHAPAQAIDRTRQRFSAHVDRAIRFLELALRFRRHPLALEADAIEPAHPRRVSFDEHEGWTIFEDFAATADEREPADAHELMNADHTRDVRAFAHGAMPRELGEIGHHDAVSDVTIVRDVHVGEQVAVRSDRRRRTGVGAAVDGHILADLVAIADADVGNLAAEFLVLRRAADDRERIDDVLFADRRVALHDDVCKQFRSVSDRDVLADQTIRAD